MTPKTTTPINDTTALKAKGVPFGPLHSDSPAQYGLPA